MQIVCCFYLLSEMRNICVRMNYRIKYFIIYYAIVA